ncbi:FeoC-like transcriptional regulator [Vibrio hannami]|uniref:FeoC-like transcriptional regulator n=1 Tax=Vibrio hannami TaxID=2717094 RepID=UPI00240F37DD|nr:FeoC-like transcriptional regulator [Vibrio hannami]MDG3085897.1 FeoC-like transcriptional regulator [Vibrio hannami]
MIVSDLKAYIEQHEGASRSTLAKHFALSEDGVEAMLEIWVKKGKLTRQFKKDKYGNTVEVMYRIVKPQDIPLDIVL